MSVLEKIQKNFKDELSGTFKDCSELKPIVRFLEAKYGYSSVNMDLRRELKNMDIYYPLDAVALRNDLKDYIIKNTAYISQFEHFLEKPFVWYYPGQRLDGWDDVPTFYINDVLNNVDLGYDFDWLRERLVGAINTYDLFIEYLSILFDNKGIAINLTYTVDCNGNTFKFSIDTDRIYLDLLTDLGKDDFGEVEMEYVSLSDLLIKLDGLALIAKNY